MMKIIKQIMTTAFAMMILATAAQAGDWLTDIDSGVAKAKKENKAVMVEFTGSDWCPSCMQMHKEVFSKTDFVVGAKKNYVLVKIDIPRKDKALYEKNQKVLEKYKVQGVPTVMLMSKDGKEFDRFTATEYPTVKKFLKQLDSALEKKDMN